ncbi:Uncharacterised protein [Halioglobus japonicus]|nr:Uncharacterised protein [Halioglobus japonicus]
MQSKPMQSQSDFDDWELASTWRATRGSHLFPNANAWNWFYRRHRDPLCAAGAVMKIRNRAYVNTSCIEPAVLEILRQTQSPI